MTTSTMTAANGRAGIAEIDGSEGTSATTAMTSSSSLPLPSPPKPSAVAAAAAAAGAAGAAKKTLEELPLDSLPLTSPPVDSRNSSSSADRGHNHAKPGEVVLDDNDNDEEDLGGSCSYNSMQDNNNLHHHLHDSTSGHSTLSMNSQCSCSSGKYSTSEESGGDGDNDDDHDHHHSHSHKRREQQQRQQQQQQQPSCGNHNGSSKRVSNSTATTTDTTATVASTAAEAVTADAQDEQQQDESKSTKKDKSYRRRKSGGGASSTDKNKKKSTKKKNGRRPVAPVVTIAQMEATMPLLKTVPCWVFDWKNRKNRWANAAALKMWDAPDLDEFLNRDMTDMSESVIARGNRLMDRTERGLVTHEQFTFYPKGNAITVNLVTTGVRMSDDEDLVCFFNYALPMTGPSATSIKKTNGTSASTSSSSQRSDDNDTASQSKAKESNETKRKSSANPDSLSSFLEYPNNVASTNSICEPDSVKTEIHSTSSVVTTPPPLSSPRTDDSNAILVDVDGDSKREESEEDDVEEDGDEEEEAEDYNFRDVVTEDTLRGVEIIRHLPIAVCQFDLNGQLMFQNPAAYMPSWGYDTSNDNNDENENGNNSKTNLNDDTKHTDASDDRRDNDSSDAIPLSLNSDKNINEDFLHRFVDKRVAKKLLDNIKKAYEDPSIVGYGNVDGNITLEAELHPGPRWSSIQLRRTVDPVTSQPVILFSAQDKSDAVLARQEREARVKKSEFLAIMAHEIRTPLHQVTGFIDLLDQNMAASKQSGSSSTCNCAHCCCSTDAVNTGQRLFRGRPDRTYPRRQSMASISDIGKDNFEEQRGYVKLLKTSAQQLMTVISDVLDYSKLEVGEMRFECIAYEPLSVVKGSMEAVRQSCVEKGLRLALDDWSKDIPFRIMGDPNRLRQVLLNLLSNAVKFTKTGAITIHAETFTAKKSASKQEKNVDNKTFDEEEQRWIKFVVSDTGMGISDENRALVFQKYQQANLSIARHFGGTGLGLSICRLLVKTMGGIIDVESEEGKGSSFFFTVPAKLPQRSDSEGEGESEEVVNDDPRSRLEKNPSGGFVQRIKEEKVMNILVAEDNKINQKLVVNMLGRMGHKCSVADDGQYAIDMVCENTPDGDSSKCVYDAVLMDVQMPRMDGLEATRRLRQLGYNDLLIIGLTASVKRSDYIELGFDDWLPKPILMKDLRAKLLRLQSMKGSEAESTTPSSSQ
eukprot:CAMPEP_0113523836 /NCGR_PEP_ID=MMETSP0014_2-20120614/45906_1 /TAXON_ID=2857 /ORGANISM="Nitzschia sp." /LENGTH=1203 /DNA_ID=CAMNT_0000421929 /DNA_START=35 /DNA_END=3646 /DNA_ORIENTATION=+ /assembly_acc=CAM_ASM_000159